MSVRKRQTHDTGRPGPDFRRAKRRDPRGERRAKAVIVATFAAATIVLPRGLAAQTNGASFVSQEVATSMGAGARQKVSVTLKNTGNTMWTAKEGYCLGSQNPPENMVWGGRRVALQPAASVAPQQSTTFTFTITAPALPGSYHFQWQMLQEGREWFGASTPDVPITVLPWPSADPENHPRTRTAASSCALGCENPSWSHRNIVDSDYQTGWSSVPHETPDGYEWLAVWFDRRRDTNRILVIPRTEQGVPCGVPEFVTVYYSAGRKWKPTGVSVKLPARLPESGYAIRIPKVKTDGILLSTNRLRRSPSGDYYFQMAEVYVGFKTEATAPPSTAR